MTLHSRQFEKQLRHRVRHAIKASPELRREVKRVGKKRSTTSIHVGWFLVAMFVFLGMFVAGRIGVREQLFCITLISTLGAAAMVLKFASTVYVSPDLNALFYSPISDSDIFRRQSRVFAHKTAISVLGFALLFACAAIAGRFDGWGWLAIVFLAPVQWIVSAITAVLLISYFPRVPYRAIVVSGGIIAFMILVTNSVMGPIVAAIVSRGADMPFWVIPTGWTSFALEQLSRRNYILAATVLGLVPLYWLALQPALNRLRREYQLQEPTITTAENFVAEASAFDAEEQPVEDREGDVAPAQKTFRGGPTEVEDEIRSRSFLRAPITDRLPWLERTVLARLTERERLLIDSTRDLPVWTRQIKRAALFLLALVVLMTGMHLMGIKPDISLYCIMSFVFGAQFLPSGNPLPMTFAPLWFNGITIRWYCGFPLSYHELSKLMVKLNCMRLVAMAPLLFAFALATAWFYGFGWWVTLEITVKALWLLLAAQPGIAVFAFSSGTNDTAISWKQLFAISLFIFMALLFLGLGAGLIFLTNTLGVIACGIGTLLLSWAFHWVYGVKFNRARFDLMQITAPTGTVQ